MIHLQYLKFERSSSVSCCQNQSLKEINNNLQNFDIILYSMYKGTYDEGPFNSWIQFSGDTHYLNVFSVSVTIFLHGVACKVIL